MLFGTLVTVAGFLPIGFAQSGVGEYAGNIFWVLAISLLLSWLVAVVFVPYLGVKLLPAIATGDSIVVPAWLEPDNGFGAIGVQLRARRDGDDYVLDGVKRHVFYARAAHKKDGVSIVYSWVEWPNNEARTAGWEQMMTDERMKPDPDNNPFDGARMIYGGFAPIVEA